MDTALTLRKTVEKGQSLSNEEIKTLLNSSPLVKKLTKDFEEHNLFAIFRIMGLCEIPYAQRLSYTQKLITYINQNIATPEGFSYLGSIKEIVPCYNAMLLEAYARLGLYGSNEAQNALNWIKQYQLFDRGQSTAWSHDGIRRHGGCLRSTPCYIGIGKCVRALIAYEEHAGGGDKEVETLIEQGTAYMLRHKMFQRLSNSKPISAHITDIMFPQSYALSATDLTYIVGKKKMTAEPNVKPLLDLLEHKQTDKNKWKVDYIYSYKGYVAFDTRRKASEWISTLFPIWLSL